MIKFIRENSEIIVKFIVTHIVMSFIGIMVGLAILVKEGNVEGMSALAYIGSIFTVGFMCFLHYDEMFFFGANEGIRARSDEYRLDKFKGLKVVLISYSPVLLRGLVTILVDLFASNIDNVSPITLLIYYAVQGSYLTLYKIREIFGVSLYVIITLLPAMVSSLMGYYIGVKDKTLRGILGFKVKPPFDGPIERNKRK